MATYSLSSTYVKFAVIDYTGSDILSTFSLDITPLKFIPDFTTSPIVSNSSGISKKQLRWDFGDGTFSTELTPTHFYQWPGQYQVTLTVYDNLGNAYDSSYSPLVFVYDYVSTQIAFRDYVSLIYDVPAGRLTEPLYVDVYSSWQNYRNLSGTNLTISFYASGAKGDYNYLPATQQDKWSHLRPLSRFYTLSPNGVAPNDYNEVTDVSVDTTPVYVKSNGTGLEICNKTDTGASIAGLSGTCQVWYTDDRPGNLLTFNSPVILFASLDNSKFDDSYTQRISAFDYIDTPPYGFQNINPAVFPSVKIRFNQAAKLSISTTGIDGEGTLSTTKFDIPEISWQETEIPFVIKLKDEYNFTTKNYPPLSSNIPINVTQVDSIYDNLQFGIVTLSGDTYTPIEGIKFYQDFPAAAPQSIGSFYKGYFISPNSSENCILTASVTVLEPAHYSKDALVGWLAAPQYSSAIRLIRQEAINGFTRSNVVTISNSLTASTGSNKNVYAMAVIPAGSEQSSDYETWFTDSTNDTIFKLDIYGNRLPVYTVLDDSNNIIPQYTFALSGMPTKINNLIKNIDYRTAIDEDIKIATPNNITQDYDGNIWVTLFDSGTAIKIDTLNGYVVATATPNIPNISFASSTSYNTVSGFAGENLFLPSSIDTDVDNNIWISYAHPAYNKLIKYQGTDNYSTVAAILTTVDFPDNVIPDEICVDRDRYIWVTAHNENIKTTSINDKDDLIYKFDNNGILVDGYPLSGFKQLGNLIVDGTQNAWVIQGRETLTKIDRFTRVTSDYIAGAGYNTTDYICSIGGITCDTSNNIWVINNFDKKLYLIDTQVPATPYLKYIYSLDLSYPGPQLPPVSSYSDVYLSPYNNRLTYSQQFTAFNGNSVSWSVVGGQSLMSITQPSISSPTLTLSATRLRSFAGRNQTKAIQQSEIPVTTGDAYVFSCYLKADPLAAQLGPLYRRASLVINVNGSILYGQYTLFNLDTQGSGSVTTTQTDNVSANIEYIYDGWYRCSVAYLANNSGVADATICIGSYAGGDIAGGELTRLLIYGAQFEKIANNTYKPQKYILTTDVPILEVYTTPSDALILTQEGEFPYSTYSDGLQEFRAIGDWNGYRWINKYASPSSVVRTITGQSNMFNIYPYTGKYNISKINENWNASGFYNSLRYQESLLDKQVFFDQFLGVILGGMKAQPYELGKTVYEKIANFVSNRSDIDKMNIDALLAFCAEFTVEFEEYNYLFPPQIKRLVDLLSIKQSNLWGTQNKYALNFDARGTLFPNDSYGINLSASIDINNGVIIPGVPIVANELYSGLYKVVNADIFSSLSALPLSTYSPDWGWPLTVPDNITGIDISKYYKFFTYNPQYNNEFFNNLIDWSNSLTTLTPQNSSYESWSEDNGIIQTLLSYELTKGLNLFTSATNIVYNS